MSLSPPHSAPARSYENLRGAQGSTIYYRAQRLRPRALLTRIAPALQVGEHTVRLYDLSATGLSYLARARDPKPEAGARLPVRLSIAGVAAFAAQGEIVRHQLAGDWTKIALRFLDDHVITSKLRALHDRLDFEASAAKGLDVYRAVPTVYRAACGEARIFVEHWRKLLDERERQLRGSEEPGQAQRLAETEASAEERMRAEWRAIRATANEASRSIVQGEALTASKRYTETLLTSALRDSPLIWRTYVKPQGYPGDYLAMSWMYDGQRRGETLFARLMDQLGHEERLASTVAVRKRFLIRQIEECVAEVSPHREGDTRIVSIGAGPAREVVDYLAATPPGPAIEFTLIDQDEQALAFAYEDLHQAALPHGGRVRILCRHISFAQLFAMPALQRELGEPDMIYSAGLLDYLGDEVGRALMNGCFELIRDGGRLVVGNAAAAPDVRWMPEFVLDWTMIYRTESELLDLARDFASTAELKIERDESEAWLFLVARRGSACPPEKEF